MLRIRKAAVIGAGNMGAQIAAHLANVGIPSLLMDIVPTDLMGELGQSKIVITNFHAFLRREKVKAGELNVPVIVEEHFWDDEERPCVAVATLEGMLVNQHLGEAERPPELAGDELVARIVQEFDAEEIVPEPEPQGPA